MPTSVIVAGIVGFVLGTVTNLTMGFFCGVMLALIMWALTGFRVEDSAQVPMAAQTASDAATTTGSRKPPDVSSMAPREIGRSVAISLDMSCRLDRISDSERSLAQAAKIPIEAYYRELLVLSGFAQDYAISRLIGHSEVGKQVRAGYHEAWQNVAKSGAAGSALFQLFVKRCPDYEKAAREDEEASKDGLKSFSRLTLVFGGYIQSPNSAPSEDGAAQMLAMAHANAYYVAHFQGTAEALKSANLLT